ncbi:MAG: hypothetical protein ABGX27_08320 [Desulfurobacteriaceae bacterium]
MKDNTTQEVIDTSTTTLLTTVSGVVVDGYLKNARVCLDLNNNNKECDLGEPTATTKEGGIYTLNVPAGLVNKYPIIAEVIVGETVDEDTNQPVDKDVVLQAPPGKPDIVFSLTTLVATEIEKNPALTLEQAELKVKEQMGVSSDVSLLGDYVQKESYDDEYKKFHEVAKVVTEVVGEILDDVEDQVSEDERDALLVAVTDTVKDKLSTIVETVEETLTADNGTSTENATLDTDENLDVDAIVSQITSQVNATEIVNNVDNLDQQLEVVNDAEVSSDVLGLIGKTFYYLKEKDDNPVVAAIKFDSSNITGYGVYLTYFTSFDELLSPEYQRWQDQTIITEDGKIIAHSDYDGDVRIDSVAVVDLAGKTLKASQVFEEGMNDLEDVGLSDFNITFNSGKEYILSLTGLKQEPSVVAASLTLESGDCHQLPDGIEDVEGFVNYYSRDNNISWDYDGISTQFDSDEKLYEPSGAYGRYWFETVNIGNQPEKVLILDRGIYNHGWWGELLRIVQDKNGTYYYCVTDYRFEDSVMTFITFDEDAMSQIIDTLKNVISTSNNTDTTSTSTTSDSSVSSSITTLDEVYKNLSMEDVISFMKENEGKPVYINDGDGYVTCTLETVKDSNENIVGYTLTNCNDSNWNSSGTFEEDTYGLYIKETDGATDRIFYVDDTTLCVDPSDGDKVCISTTIPYSVSANELVGNYIASYTWENDENKLVPEFCAYFSPSDSALYFVSSTSEILLANYSIDNNVVSYTPVDPDFDPQKTTLIYKMGNGIYFVRNTFADDVNEHLLQVVDEATCKSINDFVEEADNLSTETTSVDTSSLIPSDAVETTYDELVGKTLYSPGMDNYQIELSVVNFFATDIIQVTVDDIPISNISSISDLSPDTTCSVSLVNGIYEIQCPDSDGAKILEIEKLDLTGKTITLFGRDFTFSGGTVYYLTFEDINEEGNIETSVLPFFDETAMNELLPQLKTLQEELENQLVLSQ